VTGTNQRHASGTGQRRCRVAGAAAATQARANRLCAAPHKSRAGAYAPRPGAGPGCNPRRTHSHDDSRRPGRVVLPAEPPELTPAAARALLRILIKAHAAQGGDREMDNQQPADGWEAGT
jgi:hypothetical protein